MALLGFILVAVVAVAVVIGGSIFIHREKFGKKKTYVAKCYQLTSGVIPRKKGKDGKEIPGSIELRELRPFSTDTLEVVSKAQGITLYKLKKQNITTGEVLASHIETWTVPGLFGDKSVEFVRVLIAGNNATLLEAGYDENSGSEIFTPVPREDVDLIISNTIALKDRNEIKERNILLDLAPYAVMLLGFFALITIGHSMGSAHIEATELLAESNANIQEQNELVIQRNQQMTNTIRDAYKEAEESQTQPQPREIIKTPPVIE